MPLPFIPMAIALGISALAGAKKGYDGYSDISDSKKMDEQSRSLQKEAEQELELSRVSTNTNLETLGKTKISIYTQGSVDQFIKVASRIKNMPDKELEGVLEKVTPITEVLEGLRNIRISLIEISGGLLSSATSGALASLGALGGVTAFGTASTGTSIALLSGAAAKSATLAWLGGGTLATGGFGMAGGMVMLGGIAVAPMILVGGFLLASKGKKTKEQALENRKQVESYQKSVTAICKNLSLIADTARTMTDVLEQMDNLFLEYIRRADVVISHNDDYRTYGNREKTLIKNCFLFNKHLENLVDTKLMDTNGNFINDSIENIKSHKEFIEQMNRI